MTRLTDERLRHIKDAPEGCTLDLNGVEVQALISELLLLRAECRAAREFRDSIAKSGSATGSFLLIRKNDEAREATDKAGFSP